MSPRTGSEHALLRRNGESRPSNAQVAALLRRLAERAPSELAVLSAYLDLRPPADIEDPAVRATKVIVRDRLREIDESLPRHGPAHDSFAADSARLEDLLEAGAGEHERGLAVFACDGEGLFETVRTWIPFEQRVEAGPLPFLLPLARLAGHEPAIVALADTNSLRLFVSQPGRLKELPAIDDEPDDYTRTETGGWSQARQQRHVDEHRDEFARRASAIIGRAMERTAAERLILAGDEVAIPRLRAVLATPVAERLRDVLRIELRASLDEIEAKALPTIDRLEADDARDAADRLIGAIGANGLGVGRPEPTRRALEQGAALELLLDADVGLGPPAEPEDEALSGLIPEADADELVRLASRTDAPVTFVPEHPGLRELGGVGALLRYRA